MNDSRTAEQTAAMIRVMDRADFWYGDHYFKPGNPGNPKRATC